MIKENTDELFQFNRHLADIQVDNMEYALLTAIVLFSCECSREGVSERRVRVVSVLYKRRGHCLKSTNPALCKLAAVGSDS